MRRITNAVLDARFSVGRQAWLPHAFGRFSPAHPNVCVCTAPRELGTRRAVRARPGCLRPVQETEPPTGSDSTRQTTMRALMETRSPFTCLSRLSVQRNSTRTASFDPHEGPLRLGVIILISVTENQGSEIKCLSHVPMIIGMLVNSHPAPPRPHPTQILTELHFVTLN